VRTIVPSGHSANDRAKDIPHSGIRVGEIIAYRAWRVIDDAGSEKDHERLHSVAMWDYVWHPDKPASGDVRTHGIYSFRSAIRSSQEYGYYIDPRGPLLFGKVKIWGEIVQHEDGYRSEFGKIASLDFGDSELLDRFRRIYRHQVAPSQSNYSTRMKQFP
jgi:hypothetical protein